MRRCDMWSTLLAVSGLAMLSVMPLRAQTVLADVQVNAFQGASNLPIWVAQQQGMFARRGIKVTLTSPASSVDQFKGLMAGRYSIVATAFDNVVAYRSGQGAPEVGTVADLVAVMGIDGGLFTLVALPDVPAIADLKGRTLAVDALSTGLSFALKEILQKGGVEQSEVSFISVGNSDNRWKALQAGKAQAAMLTVPMDRVAVAHGGKLLATVGASLGHYLGNVIAVRQGWAASHDQEVAAFVHGLRDAVTWLTAREHEARVIEILRAEMPALSTAELSRVYEALLGSQGIIRDGRLDAQGARAVLNMRAKYADSTQGLSDVGAYTDARYLGSAQ